MDEPTENSSRKFNSVTCYKISNILDRSVIESICSQKEVPLLYAQDSSELFRLWEGSLVVCDLTNLKNEELVSLVESAKTKNCRILGSYPHVSKEIGEAALIEGVDYVVPRSAFRRKLLQLLTN